jgi:DeoR/GlpR family transcriptional regulator of sugar metabolism
MKKQREEEILRYLETHEFLSTTQALALFGGSPATIRRAFARLVEINSAQRVHGGIRRGPADANESIPFFMREHWFADEKVRLARRAMEYAPKTGAMFIHSGSTTLALARCMDQGTVITNSINICGLLMQRFPSGGGPKIILPGGTFDLKSGVLAGPQTEAAIGHYRAETAFFSARGMDEEGLLDPSEINAAVVLAMIRNADRAVMIADHSKFRKFGLMRMISWDQVDVLVTSDHAENHPWFEMIRKHGVEIVTIPMPNAGGTAAEEGKEGMRE